LRLSRRSLLASSSAVLLRPFIAQAALAKGVPIAKIQPIVDFHFGVKVVDPYRWMEEESPEWQAYVRAQGKYTEQVLNKIRGRGELANAIGRDMGEVVPVVSIETGGDDVFIELRPAGANTAKLYVRDSLSAHGRQLIDPDTYSVAGSHASLDWWTVSPDGSHVAFGISLGGSEQSVLYILVTDSGELLSERISRTAAASPSWLPDSSGFFYNRLPDVSDSFEYEQNSFCWFHRLKTDPASDLKVFGSNLSPNVKLKSVDIPEICVTPGSKVVIGLVISGVQNELTAYAAPLASVTACVPAWTKICDPTDQITGLAVRGNEIFFLTYKNASRFRILKSDISAPHVSDAREVVPETASVIQGLVAARDAIYIVDLDAGLGGIRRLGSSGEIENVKLPFVGSIDTVSFYADTLHDGAWFLLQGWVQPTIVCRVELDGSVTQTDIAPKPPIDIDLYSSQELLVSGRTGVKIPLSIVYRRDLQRDGKAPLMMEAFGSYGVSVEPFFIARWLPFLDLGGVYAVAHVRGGGELGQGWHTAGQKMNKHHSWEDAIDVAEYLIEEGWTSSQRLGVYGSSAGGITVGRFVTERPDLAAVIIDDVGVSDPIRSEFSSGGQSNIPEFGSVATEEGFRALYEMDPYQHVRDGVAYPSFLLNVGLHDPRVAPWEVTKLTARLQAATSSGNPILLRVETDAGHGNGSTRKQRDSAAADMIAFLMWRTGNTMFQLDG
jgi:prolyl oligopeptidase